MTVTARDPGGLSDSKTFTWTITNANRPPVVTAPVTQNNNEGVTITPLKVVATDPDSDTLIYSATGLPPGLSINSSTGFISGTLTYASAGTHNVTVKATDPSGLFDSKTFIWNVTNVNRPVYAVADSASVVQGQAVVINVLANDSTASGMTLTVTNVGSPGAGNGSTAISGGGTTVTYTAGSLDPRRSENLLLHREQR